MTSHKDIGRKNVLGNKDNPDPKGLPEIHGYNFDNGIDYEKLIESFATTGFQATNLAQAIELVKTMRKEKCTIYLGYTSNMVTSGLRDIFRYLAEHNLIDCIVTTAGGIEEDIIKSLQPFLLGTFNADGKTLREQQINRVGNIYIPSSRYGTFEDFLIPFLNKITKKEPITPSEFIKELGKEINNKDSIYYWCYKNNIPVFCPALTDGSIGDLIYFHSFEHPEFKIDIAKDIRTMHEFTFNAKKTGVIILGGGLVKHHILNTNLMRNGCNYAVYFNTSEAYDGSEAGASPDEAISWGKLTSPNNKNSVKVHGDATILFPLVVAQTFAQKN